MTWTLPFDEIDERTGITGDRIRQAREVVGLTQKELAEQIGVEQPYISMWERGRRSPDSSLLESIALLTRFPVSFFRRPEGPELPEGSFLYRSRKYVTARERARIRQCGRIGLELAMVLAKDVEAPELRIPVLQEPPIRAARMTRSAFGLPPDKPVPNITRAMERSGALVVVAPVNAEGFEAFSTWAGTIDRRPVIVRDRPGPGDRDRATMAHELGHVVLHARVAGGDHKALDSEAWEFARELLFPSEVFRDLWPDPITISDLADLKAQWGISISAMITWAFDLDLITANQRKYLYQKMAQKGMRREEPVPIPAERPRLLLKLAELKFGRPVDAETVAEAAKLPVRLVRRMLAAHSGDTSSGASDAPSDKSEQSSRSDAQARVIDFRSRSQRPRQG